MVDQYAELSTTGIGDNPLGFGQPDAAAETAEAQPTGGEGDPLGSPFELADALADLLLPTDFALITNLVETEGAAGMGVGTEENTFLSGRLYAFVDGAPTYRGYAVSPPTLIGASSTVCEPPSVAVNGLDTTFDSLFVVGTLLVTSTNGSEVLSVTASVDIARTGPGSSGSCDWTSAVSTPVAGTDLAWSSTDGVSSTAGGIFVVTLSYELEWD